MPPGVLPSAARPGAAWAPVAERGPTPEALEWRRRAEVATLPFAKLVGHGAHEGLVADRARQRGPDGARRRGVFRLLLGSARSVGRRRQWERWRPGLRRARRVGSRRDPGD